MIKLSQRAWNNVIIVSMLILIMLFNFSSDFLNGGSDRNSSLLTLVPAGMTITTIEFQSETVERIGQGWRSTSGLSNNKSLAALVEHWNNAQVSLFEQSVDWQPSGSSIALWFAGQPSPLNYQFMQLADKTLVRIDGQTYELVSPTYQTLTLSE
jgi:hypothetical protein